MVSSLGDTDDSIEEEEEPAEVIQSLRSRGIAGIPWHVLAATLASATSLLGDGTLYAVLPVTYEQLGLTSLAVGVILSANRWVRLWSNAPAKALLEHFPIGISLSVTLLLAAGCSVAYAAAWPLATVMVSSMPVFSLLLAARLAWGCCWSVIRYSGLWTCSDSIRHGYGNPAATGRIVGLYDGFARFGSVFGNVIGAVLFDILHWPACFGLLAFASAVVFPLGYLSRRGLPDDHALENKAFDAICWCARWIRPSKQDDEGQSSHRCAAPSVPSSSRAYAGFVCGMVGNGLVISTLGRVLQLRGEGADFLDVFGVSIGLATVNGVLLATRWGAESLGGPIIGALCDRIGRGSIHRISLFCGSICLLSMAAYPSAWPEVGFSTVVVFLFIFATGVTIPVLTEATECGTTATYVTSWDLGSAVGPLVGYVFIWLDCYRELYVLGSILYSIGLITSTVAFVEGTAPPGLDEVESFASLRPPKETSSDEVV